MLISHKGHTDTIQVYYVTVMTHVKALQAGHSSQGTSEPITPARIPVSKCDIPLYRAFPRNPFIINISMYFGATEKWYVQMVMVSRVVQLAGASDAPPGTRVSNRGVCGVILVIADV